MNLLKKSVTVLAAATMLVSLVGCSSSSSDSSAEKVFRFGQSNPKVGLDMQTNSNAGASSVADNVVEGLYRWNDDNEEECVLATDFPTISDDGLTYTITLKEGVKFSDGSDLTSEDVKYTFERMFTPDTGAVNTYMYDMIAGAQDMLDGKATELSGFKVIDDLNFSITLSYKSACFVKNLGMDYAVIYPSDACAAAGSDWGTGTNLIGTGPYVITENDDQTKVVFEPNTNYHGGTPNLDRLEIIYYDDVSTKMMAYENGDIDMCDLDKTLLDQYADSDIKDEITQVTPLGTYFISLRVDQAPLNDAKVREAISLAIDRDSICESVLNGAAEPATSFLNPSVPGHDDTLEPYEHNVDKAKQLLEEANATGLEFTMKVRQSEEKLATAIQANLKEAGITMNVETIDNGIWSEERAAGSLQATIVGWFPLYADADNQMYTYYYSENAVGKGVFYSNEEFDALMTEARQTVDDEDKRAELYKKADYILSREDYGTVPLYYGKLQFVAKPYVKNAKLGNLIYHLYDIDIDLDKK
jgi:peptide/nickel transport system substrate-binding protein